MKNFVALLKAFKYFNYVGFALKAKTAADIEQRGREGEGQRGRERERAVGQSPANLLPAAAAAN